MLNCHLIVYIYIYTVNTNNILTTDGNDRRQCMNTLLDTEERARNITIPIKFAITQPNSVSVTTCK